MTEGRAGVYGRRLLPLVLYAVLAVGLIWPAALHPVAAVPGAPRTDLWDSLWSFWYFARRLDLLSGSLPTDVGGILNHPTGGQLWVADPVNALLAAPLLPWLGPAASWTLLVHLHLTLTGWFGHHLGEAVSGGRPGAGWVSGVALAASPVVLAQIHNGASEAVAGEWVILAAWTLWRLGQAPGWARAAQAGGALGLATVAHWYGGLEAWVLWAVFAIGAVGSALRRGSTSRGRVGRILAVWAVAALIGLALAAPAAMKARAVSTAADNVVGIKGARELMTLRRSIGPADPRGFLHPGAFRSPDFSEISRYQEQYVHCSYLGWVLLAAAVAGTLRARSQTRSPGGATVWWIAAVLGLILAMGPVLVQDGGPVILPGRLAIPLPYLLVERLPGFSGLSLLYRLTWLAVVCLAALAARGLQGRAAWAVAALLLVETRLWSPAADLPGHTDATLPLALQVLAEAPDGAVMNFPVVGGRAYLYEQTVHGKPLAGTLNFPNNAASMRIWKVALQHAGGPPEALVVAVRARAQAEGVRYLVHHMDPTAVPDAHDAAVAALVHAFPPMVHEDGLTVLAFY